MNLRLRHTRSTATSGCTKQWGWPERRSLFAFSLLRQQIRSRYGKLALVVSHPPHRHQSSVAGPDSGCSLAAALHRDEARAVWSLEAGLSWVGTSGSYSQSSFAVSFQSNWYPELAIACSTTQASISRKATHRSKQVEFQILSKFCSSKLMEASVCTNAS